MAPLFPTAAGSDEQIRREHLSHEASLKSVGVLWLLGGTVMLLVSAALLLRSMEEIEFMLPMALIYLALGSVSLWSGWMLRKLDGRGRIPGMVLAGVGLIGFPVGTVISGYILYLLGSKKGAFILSETYRGIVARTPQVKRRTSPVVWAFLGLMVLVAVVGIVSALVH